MTNGIVTLGQLESHLWEAANILRGPVAQWKNKDRLSDTLLRDLIEHFSRISRGSQAAQADVLGQSNEYLIKKFADATNKKAGEFYTPRLPRRSSRQVVPGMSCCRSTWSGSMGGCAFRGPAISTSHQKRFSRSFH